jgi:hypothetical protein
MKSFLKFLHSISDFNELFPDLLPLLEVLLHAAEVNQRLKLVIQFLHFGVIGLCGAVSLGLWLRRHRWHCVLVKRL